jgi:hypothetical protein
MHPLRLIHHSRQKATDACEKDNVVDGNVEVVDALDAGKFVLGKGEGEIVLGVGEGGPKHGGVENGSGG